MRNMADVKLGLVAGYAPASLHLPEAEILEAERLGYDSVWTSEAYGSDAVSPAAWLLAKTTRIRVGTAIMQMPARTPTCTAMTAMTLNLLSGGRFLLGIGPSGPRVSEGWYGVPFGSAPARTREYIAIVRKIAAREEPLVHDGRYYQIPWHGPGASGLGSPIKSILHADRGLRIYTAAVAPKGLELAAEIADGVFPIWMNPERPDLYEPHFAAGLAKSGRSRQAFDVAPLVQVVLGDDLDACRRPVREHLALYIGGMGPRERNFYNDYAKRMGYEADAVRVQELYLAGEKAAAAAAVPDRLVDEVALVGPAARIRERLVAWREAARRGHVGAMLFAGATVPALRLLAEELL
jgi:F420-dependent oxidoreductase-like protein